MVFIWGGNYSLIKATLAVLPPRPFNALRMAIASAAFLMVLTWVWARHARLSGTAARPPVATIAANAARAAPAASSPTPAAAPAPVVERILGCHEAEPCRLGS